MEYNIRKATEFLEEFLAVDIKARILPADMTKGIPFALLHAYSFYSINVQGRTVVFSLAHNPDNCTPSQLAKHQRIIAEKTTLPNVFVLSSVESYNLKRLTKAGVNFIVPGRIIYAPCMMLLLRNLPNSRKVTKEEMPPVAQLLVLYHLQRDCLNGCDAYRLTDTTGMAYTTIIKAIKWLETNGIITLSGTKQKTLTFVSEGEALWQKAFPLMSSPIERIRYADEMATGLIAGETALGAFTMLAEPAMPVVAISKPAAKGCERLLDKHSGDIKVEIWKYNPALLAEDGKVDRLSLFLSLKDSTDERVQMECDTLLKEIKW
ncbi:MAG: hypothetical protein Q4B68_00190 [Bacteroidales bacterium]|nr:hypothetical protein [Bacteroidales bacterium]